MNLSLRKVWLIFKIRANLSFKNPTIAMFPFLAIGYVLIFKSIITANRGPAIIWILSMAVLFNTIMSGLMLSTIPLVTEKENKTLSVLLNSKVNAKEYIAGTTGFSLVFIVITNLVAVIVSGISWQQLPLFPFILLSVVTVLISTMIGDAVAILFKTQILAGFVTLPLMFLLAIVPMFKSFSAVASNISDLTYSGVMMNFMIRSVATGKSNLNGLEVVTLLCWLIGSFLLFLLAYRKKGLA